MKTRTSLILCALAVLVLAGTAQAGILNETTFNLSGGVPIETITDGGGTGYSDPQNGDTNFTPGSDTINGWTFYLETSATNRMTFAPGSTLALAAPSGIGEAQLGTKVIQTMTWKTIVADVLNIEFGVDGVISGIAQTFTSLGAYEVTITVGWHRHERDGNGLDIVDGTGQFGKYDYTYKNADPKTYTHTFTPTQSTFRLYFGSNLGADTNGQIDYIKVSQVPEPATMALMGLGGLGLDLGRKRK